jgi:solute carrier family 8 (sodium/calcium exchanger)
VNLDKPCNNCALGEPTRAVVRIIDDDADRLKTFSSMMLRIGYNSDKWDVVMEEWRQQFFEAVAVPVEEDDMGERLSWRTATPTGWAVHIVAVVWKVFAAFVPPVRLGSGWPAFVFALLFIGFVTMMIQEVATFFGCVLGCPPAINAITFVALGTSLPDTFASKTAALGDEDADASVGNVTGSNSVNVFLGIGMPWIFASVYWRVRGPNQEWLDRYAADYPDAYGDGWATFIVEGGDLAFSVGIYSGLAMCAILLLFARRKLCAPAPEPRARPHPFEARVPRVTGTAVSWAAPRCRDTRRARRS